MKKVIRFFAIVAAMAGMMAMTSCKDNPENDEDANRPTTPGIQVTFGDDTWQSIEPDVLYWGSFDCWGLFAQKEANKIPYCELVVKAPKVGEYSDEIIWDQHAYTGEMIQYIEYTEQCTFYWGNNVPMSGDWWAKTAKVKVESIDLNAMMLSATIKCTMFNAFKVASGEPEENKDMVVYVTDMKMNFAK